MKARRPKAPTASKTQPLVQRVDERNVARLGLISLHERIPDSYTSWEVTSGVLGHATSISCIAHAQHGGVPHGLDGDIASALVDIYVSQGSDTGGEIAVTARQLLLRAGLATTGRYYDVLHASLQRLQSSTYTIRGSWRSGPHWKNVHFSYIEGLEYTSSEEKKISNSSTIKLRLAKPIVASIRANYIKPLDVSLLARMERMHTRALYRLLDAKRYDVGDPEQTIDALDMLLVDWARECKLVDLKPSRIRRTLDPAHEELLKLGYLRHVDYTGTRENTRVHYVYGDAARGNDPDVASALRRHGISDPVINRLLKEQPAEELRDRLDKAEFLIRQRRDKVFNPSGYIIRVLEDDGTKYPPPVGWVPPSRRAQSQPAQRKAASEPELPGAADPLDAMTNEEKIDYTIQLLANAFSKRLDVMVLAGLRTAMEEGNLSPQTVRLESMRALASGKEGEFCQELRLSFGPQPSLLNAQRNE